MSRKTKIIFKIIAIAFFLLAVGMQFGWIIIPLLNGYKFWMLVIGFLLLLFSN